jgi:hypothetical protein
MRLILEFDSDDPSSYVDSRRASSTGFCLGNLPRRSAPTMFSKTILTLT